jgi:hypothetical protein
MLGTIRRQIATLALVAALAVTFGTSVAPAAAQISTSTHTCALKTDGTLWCW